MKLIRLSSEKCGACGRASTYDSDVATEEGLELIEVKQEDRPTYRQWFWVMDKINFAGWPTYVMVDGDQVVGTIAGAMPRGTFKTRLRELKGRQQNSTQLQN